MTQTALDASHHPEAWVLATTNLGKVHELKRLLGELQRPLIPLSEFSSPAVEENEATVEGNAVAKATGYAANLKRWVLADDTGLFVRGLDGQPGVRSARFAGPQATAEDNRKKLVGELRDFPQELRSAEFRCCLVLASPDGEPVLRAEGVCRGRIVDDEAGQFGFGYDRLFWISEYGCRLAELGPSATDLIGHRGQAARNLMRLVRQRGLG